MRITNNSTYEGENGVQNRNSPQVNIVQGNICNNFYDFYSENYYNVTKLSKILMFVSDFFEVLKTHSFKS